MKLAEKGTEVGRIASRNVEIATGHSAGDDEGSRFDAVGNDAVLRTVQFTYTLNADGGRACAFNLRSHFVEQVGKIGDLGFARAVLQNSLAFGEGRGHQQVFCAGDRNFVENNFRAFEALGRGFDVSMFLCNLRAKAFKSFDVQVDRSSANRAAAGKREQA